MIAWGPNLALWIGEKGAEDESLLQKQLEKALSENPPQETGEIIRYMDELIHMNLPLAALKLKEIVESPGNFWLSLLEGVACLMTGDFSQAQVCFVEAQALEPSEIAPYTNMAILLTQKGALEEASLWCEAGLKWGKNDVRLWQQVETVWLKRFSFPEVWERLEALATQYDSWLGTWMITERKGGDSQTISSILKDFYQRGERSLGFLTAYTGVLGELECYAEIPPLFWVARSAEENQRLPWQLLAHTLQAHLALHQDNEVKTLKNLLKSYKNEIPSEVWDGWELSS